MDSQLDVLLATPDHESTLKRRLKSSEKQRRKAFERKGNRRQPLLNSARRVLIIASFVHKAVLKREYGVTSRTHLKTVLKRKHGHKN